MADLTNIERSFVLEDVSVFAEFDENNLITNAKVAIGSELDSITSVRKIHHYSEMLEKSINTFIENTAKIDPTGAERTTRVLEVLAKRYEDGANGVYMPSFNPSRVNMVKPQYIKQFTDIVVNLINKVMEDDSLQKSEVDKVLSYKVSGTVIKQVIQTNSEIKSVPDMVRSNNRKPDALVTPAYVENEWKPFIATYDKYSKQLMAFSDLMLAEVKKTEESVNNILSVANQIRRTPNIPSNKIAKVNYVVYYGIRAILETISCVTYILIHNINALIDNEGVVNRISVMADNAVNSGGVNISEATTDSITNMVFPDDTHALTDELMNGQCSAYITVANNIISFYDPNNNVEDSDLVFKPDGDVYQVVKNIYAEIQRGLDLISAKSDDYLLIFDDIISKSGFSVRLAQRFDNDINSIDNIGTNLVEPRETNETSVMALVKEVKVFKDNIPEIAKVIKDTKDKVEMLKDRFENNINGEFKDAQSVNELKIFLEDLLEQLTTMTNSVSSKLYSRLIKLSNLLNSVSKPDEGDNATPETIADPDIAHTDYHMDYSESVFIDELNDLEEDIKNRFHALESQYFIDKALSLRNVNLILEAEGDATSNNTAPKVTDNSAPTDNANNTTQQGSLSSIAGKIKEAVQKVIDKFTEYINRTGVKNDKWIAQNKDELTNRNYSNVSLAIVPYNRISADSVIADIGKFKNVITTITPQTLQGYTDEANAYTKLFTFITGGVKPGDGKDKSAIATQVKTYYKCGNSQGPLETVNVANGELKNFVTNDMIPYVSNFNNGYVTNVENALKDLSTAADEAIKKANATATPNKDAQKNTQGNMSAKAAYVSSAVKYYSSGVINAIRDRNADYLIALDYLVPKNANTNNAANQVKTDNNQQANQQQQNQAQEQQNQPAQA